MLSREKGICCSICLASPHISTDVALTQIVSLLIIDEVHLLHSERGAVLEVSDLDNFVLLTVSHW